MHHQLGNEFKSLREKAGLTQQQASKGLGYVTPQFISNVERGLALMPASKFKKAATLYKTKPEAFIKLSVAAMELDMKRVVFGASTKTKVRKTKSKKATKRPARKAKTKAKAK